MLGLDLAVNYKVQVRGSSRECGKTILWPRLSNCIEVSQDLRNGRAEIVHVVSAGFHVGVQGAPQKQLWIFWPCNTAYRIHDVITTPFAKWWQHLPHKIPCGPCANGCWFQCKYRPAIFPMIPKRRFSHYQPLALWNTTCNSWGFGGKGLSPRLIWHQRVDDAPAPVKKSSLVYPGKLVGFNIWR